MHVRKLLFLFQSNDQIKLQNVSLANSKACFCFLAHLLQGCQAYGLRARSGPQSVLVYFWPQGMVIRFPDFAGPGCLGTDFPLRGQKTNMTSDLLSQS